MKPRRFVSLTATAIPILRRVEFDGGNYYTESDVLLSAVADDGSGWYAWIQPDDQIEDAKWTPVPAIPDAPSAPLPPPPPSALGTLRSRGTADFDREF
jgi:hypothetical protein